MRYIDLELHRWQWQWHNEVYLQAKRIKDASKTMPLPLYWKEYGAFVSVIPRQLGKTTMIGEIINYLSQSVLLHNKYDINDEDFIMDDVLVVVPTRRMINFVVSKIGIPRRCVCSINGFCWYRNVKDTKNPQKHLFVDEFDFIDRKDISHLLDWNWKSVTMVSSLK